MCRYQWNIRGKIKAPISWKGWQGDPGFSVALKTEEEIVEESVGKRDCGNSFD